jgi:serine/threonine protein phosphatase PrpC
MWPLKKSNPKRNALKFQIAGATDTGKVRDHNEDAYRAPGEDQSPPGAKAVLLVADGMGGHAAGEIASTMTVDGILKLMRSEGEDTTNFTDQEFRIWIGRVLERVNEQVYEAAQEPGQNGMGTTCTLGVIRKQTLFLGHVGDSRGYLLREGKLHQVTTDHSWVEEEVSKGKLTAEQARVHPRRNVITRAIGIEQTIKIDVSSVNLMGSDKILLASDGLTTMVQDNEIEEIIQSDDIEESCNTLIRTANGYGGLDNITVVLASIYPGFNPNEKSNTTTSNKKTLKPGTRRKSIIKKIFRRG